MILRRRVAGLGCLAALASSGACAPNDDGSSPSRPPVGARRVAAAELRPEGLVEAVLEECHRPLRARMQRVKATVELEGEAPLLLQAALPDRARIRAGKDEWLVVDGRVRALTGAAVSPPEAQRLRDIVAVVDAAAFGPLYRAASCARADDAYTLLDDSGRPTQLTLFAQTLLPSSFHRWEDRVDVLDYLRTPTSWVARLLAHPRLGPCRVVFEDGGVQFPDGYFDRPGDGAQPRKVIRAPVPGVVVETQSPTPIVVDGKATQLVMLPAPGDWAARHDAYRPVVEELQLQGQRIAGFPCLFVDEDRSGLMAAPFRQRPGGDRFAAPDGFVLSEVPAQRILVVYPPDGDVDARVAAGRRLLERALANRGLVAAGPMIAQPFLHLHEAPPTPAELSAASVRVWVPIE